MIGEPTHEPCLGDSYPGPLWSREGAEMSGKLRGPHGINPSSSAGCSVIARTFCAASGSLILSAEQYFYTFAAWLGGRDCRTECLCCVPANANNMAGAAIRR